MGKDLVHIFKEKVYFQTDFQTEAAIVEFGLKFLQSFNIFIEPVMRHSPAFSAGSFVRRNDPVVGHAEYFQSGSLGGAAHLFKSACSVAEIAVIMQ